MTLRIGGTKHESAFYASCDADQAKRRTKVPSTYVQSCNVCSRPVRQVRVSARAQVFHLRSTRFPHGRSGPRLRRLIPPSQLLLDGPQTPDYAEGTSSDQAEFRSQKSEVRMAREQTTDSQFGHAQRSLRMNR
jgi:hypothetical protein